MTIKDLPLVYNIDKVHIYYNGYKIAHFWRKSNCGLYEQAFHHCPTDVITNGKIESFGFIIEGVLPEPARVLEIYLK